jgi:uncharacterized protein
LKPYGMSRKKGLKSRFIFLNNARGESLLSRYSPLSTEGRKATEKAIGIYALRMNKSFNDKINSMKNLKIYLFGLLFLIAALLFSFLLAIFSEICPGRAFFDPIWQLPLLGPALASIFFILIIKKDKFSDVAIKPFKIKPLLIVVLLYLSAVVIEKVIQLSFGFADFQIDAEKEWIFNKPFNPILGAIIFSLLTIFFSGFGEEFGWRGYLYYKLKGLSWIELVLFINIIWAFWHLPMFISGYMSKGNILINFPLFIIACIEFGIILLYVRIKTKSVIASMILHPCANIFNGVIAMRFMDINHIYFAGWPNVIAVIVLLPFAIYYYRKGKELYYLELTN